MRGATFLALFLLKTGCVGTRGAATSKISVP